MGQSNHVHREINPLGNLQGASGIILYQGISFHLNPLKTIFDLQFKSLEQLREELWSSNLKTKPGQVSGKEPCPTGRYNHSFIFISNIIPHFRKLAKLLWSISRSGESAATIWDEKCGFTMRQRLPRLTERRKERVTIFRKSSSIY